LSSRQLATTHAHNAAVVQDHPTFCFQQTIGIYLAEISQIIGALEPRDRDPPIGTDHSSIEHGKQFTRVADVDCTTRPSPGAATRRDSRWCRRGRAGRRRIRKRLRIIRAGAGECAGSRAVAAKAGVIGVVGVNIGRRFASDGDYDIVKDRD